MDKNKGKLCLKEEIMSVKTEVEIKEEPVFCEEGIGIPKDNNLFDHEGSNPEWQVKHGVESKSGCKFQGYQKQDEIMENISVKEETLDFTPDEMKIEGHSNQMSTVTEKLSFDKKSLADDEQPRSTSAFDANYLFRLKNEKNSKVVQKIFKCKACPYETGVKHHFQIHLRIHTGEKPFKCEYCSFSTAQSSHIKRHERTHTGEKPFKCGDCSFSATTSFSLKVHLRIHTGEKPFKCRNCSFSSTRKSDLNRHLRIHTGEKPFKCEFCSYSTADKPNLIKHSRLHTGEKPFKCKICFYSASNSSSLKKHSRIHTSDV